MAKLFSLLFVIALSFACKPAVADFEGELDSDEYTVAFFLANPDKIDRVNMFYELRLGWDPDSSELKKVLANIEEAKQILQERQDFEDITEIVPPH